MRITKDPKTHEIYTLFDSGTEARKFAHAVRATQVKAREECMPEWVMVMTWSRAFEQATGRTSSSPADIYQTATVVAPGKILWAVLEHFSTLDEPAAEQVSAVTKTVQPDEDWIGDDCDRNTPRGG